MTSKAEVQGMAAQASLVVRKTVEIPFNAHCPKTNTPRRSRSTPNAPKRTPPEIPFSDHCLWPWPIAIAMANGHGPDPWLASGHGQWPWPWPLPRPMAMAAAMAMGLYKFAGVVWLSFLLFLQKVGLCKFAGVLCLRFLYKRWACTNSLGSFA